MKSLITYILLLCFITIFSFTYYPKFKAVGSEATISWDVSGYYWYLPALFIYHDLKDMKFSDSIRKVYGCSPDNQQISYLDHDVKVLKYSSGMALQYLPFFMMANVVANPLGYKADGFSRPYQIAIHLGALWMCMLGLWFLRKVLLDYFKDITVAWVLFFLVIGTNYLNYAAIDVGMSHCWLFAWYCLLIYQAHLFYKRPTYQSGMVIGLIVGLLVLTRPTEIVAILIPVLWGVNLFSLSSVKERLSLIRLHFGKYLLAVFCMILVGTIQLVYWKYASGHWFVYSYGDQEFTWLKPHFMDYLLSYRSGWLLYCPMMIMPYLGFIFLAKRKELFWTVALFSFAYLWIVAAWDIWWYGGRAMIQAYAILAFPFAALIEFVHKRMITKLLFFSLAFLFLYVNIWWVHGVHKGGIISATDMTKAYYEKVLLKWEIEESDRKFLDIDEEFTGTLSNTDTLFVSHFSALEDDIQIVDGVYCLALKQNKAAIKIFPIAKKPNANHWIRASATIQCVQNNWDILRMTGFAIRFSKNKQFVKENGILLDRLFYKSKKQRIHIDAFLSPKEYDQVDILFSNNKDAQGAFYISDLVVESFR